MKNLESLQEDKNYLSAMEYLKNEDVKNALLSLEKTVKENPDHYIAWNNIGFLLYKTDYIEEAKKGFEKALSIEPDYIDACVNLFFLCKKKGLLDEAKVYKEKVQNLDPENPDLKEMQI